MHKSKRQSNFELLRIVAMFMVKVLHFLVRTGLLPEGIFIYFLINSRCISRRCSWFTFIRFLKTHLHCQIQISISVA